MATLASEVLDVWQATERLLVLLGPENDDRQPVVDALHGLQLFYRQLRQDAVRASLLVELTLEHLATTRRLLSEARARLDTGSVPAWPEPDPSWPGVPRVRRLD